MYTLPDVWIRPPFGGKGRKMTGQLEAHANGFRYTSPRGEQLDIMYRCAPPPLGAASWRQQAAPRSRAPHAARLYAAPCEHVRCALPRARSAEACVSVQSGPSSKPADWVRG